MAVHSSRASGGRRPEFGGGLLELVLVLLMLGVLRADAPCADARQVDARHVDAPQVDAPHGSQRAAL